MAACRRCARDVPAGATVCDYCGLENPLAAVKQVSAPIMALAVAAPGKTRRIVIGAFLGLLVILGTAGVLIKRAIHPAPVCDAASVKTNVSGLLHDNAVYELSPDLAARFPDKAFTALEQIEGSGELSGAQSRSCTATFAFSGDAAAMDFVAGASTAPPATLNPNDRALLTKYWHASARRLEIPVTYKIVPAKAGSDSPWDLTLGDKPVAELRDIVGVLARMTHR